VVQVIVALCELGIDPLDSRFVKNGHTLVDNLMDYFNPDGSFRHTDDGSGENQMATEQGFYCLAALSRLRHGQNSLYRMGDCTLSVSGNTGLPTLGLPGKHEDVKKVPVLYPGKTFADIEGHENLTAMNALCERGIIDGMTPTAYVPDETMTRAQFSAIVVRGLGLPLLKTDNFKDVDADEWYAEYVGAAFTYGIVEGTTPTTFNPGGNITKQEAALMLSRAAKLCGFETQLESYEVLNLLAPFGDYITASDWAREGLAFCYREGILDESELNIEPKRPVLRCEIAQMVYNLLTAANLM